MRFSQIISEMSTTAGSVSTVAKPLGEVAKRPQVDGLQPVSKVMSGKAKKKGPYANSLSESKKHVEEAELSEDDIILVPGQGRLRKSGFVKNDPDRAEHEGETLKNSLHTIIRVATHLDKQLSTQDNFPEWVSEKIGATKSMMVQVMDYLISAQEMQHDPDAMESVSEAGMPASVLKNKQKYAAMSDSDFAKAHKDKSEDDLKSMAHRHGYGKNSSHYVAKRNKGQQGVSEGAKVDRMVKHIEKSEEKAGKGKKEAENIAWATANKRGMLDNKNKKK